MSEPMWTPKGSRPMPIRLMSDSHLNNAILMLRRVGYITTDEAGPKPRAISEQRVWASKPASTQLDALADERLDRIKTGRSVSEQEAEQAQRKWYSYELPEISGHADVIHDLSPGPSPFFPRYEWMKAGSPEAMTLVERERQRQKSTNDAKLEAERYWARRAESNSKPYPPINRPPPYPNPPNDHFSDDDDDLPF